jgi:flagellar motor switch protein FliM
MSSPHPRTSGSTRAAAPARLDSRSLGRPVHLLPGVAEALREALQRQLCQAWNRRYRARYELQSLTIKPISPQAQGDEDGRWLRGTSPWGPLACLIERPLVLGLMNHRLGLAAPTGAHDAVQPAVAPDQGLRCAPVPPTATEERLHQWLAQQLCGLSLQLLQQQVSAAGTGMSALDGPALAPLQFATQAGVADGGWLMQLSIADAALPDQAPSRVLLALDAAHLAPLLRQLSQAQRASRPVATPPQPLERRLSLRLQARLLERQLSLGELLDLQPGALIPVHLAAATVLVEDAPLLRAAVAEHRGKLCLTSFQDLE